MDLDNNLIKKAKLFKKILDHNTPGAAKWLKKTFAKTIFLLASKLYQTFDRYFKLDAIGLHFHPVILPYSNILF